MQSTPFFPTRKLWFAVCLHAHHARLQECFDFAFYLKCNRRLFCHRTHTTHVSPSACLHTRSQECFDFVYYLKRNPDLLFFNASGGALSLWKHFIFFGQFEPRQFRWVPLNELVRGGTGGIVGAVWESLDMEARTFFGQIALRLSVGWHLEELSSAWAS